MEQVGERAVVFLPWSSIEAEAQQQIMNTAKMPFVFKHVAVMPDCHYGKGATVGTVLPTDGIATYDVDYFALTPPPGNKGFCNGGRRDFDSFAVWRQIAIAQFAVGTKF